MLQHLDLFQGQNVSLIQANSLDALPHLIENNKKFDVFLLDGDHNYYTVSQELKLIQQLVKPSSLVIVDDYNGKWSEKDLWYSQREDYVGVNNATKPIDTEKQGVKSAVDEFIANTQGWNLTSLMPGEPVLLFQDEASPYIDTLVVQ
jgi:predicted O-methyltransferase YrrM